jgi:hypothetical protein
MSANERRYADSLPASWLAARLGVEPKKLDAMRRAGELIAVREPGTLEWHYPAWQFEDWKPRHAVPRIVGVARNAGIDDARLYEILTGPRGLVGTERRLIDLLDEGREDDVVAAVRASV